MIRTDGVASTPCNDDSIANTVQPSAVGQGGQQATKPARTARHPHDGLPSRQRQKQAPGPSVAPDAHSRKPLTATTKTGLPRMLSPADVAALLQVSTKTVRRWIEAGELRVHTLGRQLRVSDDDLYAFVKSKRR